MQKRIKKGGKRTKYPHEDPEMVSQDRLHSHVMLTGFFSVDESRRHCLQTECSPFSLKMCGLWEFELFSTVEAAFAAREKKDRVPGGNIYVPSNWQLSAMGQNVTDIPIYTNVKYIMPCDPPKLPSLNTCGYYRKTFEISPNWTGRRILISFGGVDSSCYLYINGHYVGFSSDSRLPAEFDITTYVMVDDRPNDNNNFLEVIVPRFSVGSYLEDQDMWNLSGIYREVIIYSLPQPLHICDFKWSSTNDYSGEYPEEILETTIAVQTSLEWNTSSLLKLTDGSSHLNTQNPYYSQISNDWTVSIDLYSEGVMMFSRHSATAQNIAFDNPLASPSAVARVNVPLPIEIDSSKTTTRIHIDTILNLANPVEWTAENPHVYTLVISLCNARENTVVQSESCRVGIRTVDIKEGVLLINRKPILIRGVNWHEHDPVTGHTISRDLIEADIKLMKRNNFNAVRMSHYPQTQWSYELCTLYGLYVIDECNIETHGMQPYVGKLGDLLAWRSAHMTRLTRMYERDKIYPCIIGWSLGNESGYTEAHKEMAKWIRAEDPTRLIWYEPASYGHVTDNSDTSDMIATIENPSAFAASDTISPMYLRPSHCVELAKVFPNKPVILCEYAHMMGNSGGNLIDYWKAFHEHKRLQGGFIWDWVDQGLSVGHFWAYGGDWAEQEIIHDAQFCINGLTWPDRGLGCQLSDSRPLHGYGKDIEMKISNRCYGLAPSAFLSDAKTPNQLTCSPSFAKIEEIEEVPLRRSEKSSFNLSPRRLVNNESFFGGIDVDGALAKPGLLEAKVCMQYFDCKMLKTTCWPSFSGVSSLGTGIRRSSTSSNGKEIEEPLLILEIEIDITNRFDHTPDINEAYEFTAYALYDGIVVGQEPLLPYGDLPNQTFVVRFCLQMMIDSINGSQPINKLVAREHMRNELKLFGIKWPETSLLSSQDNVLQELNDIIDNVETKESKTRGIFWSTLRSGAERWEIVVIPGARTHMSWAPKGFPLGIQQLKIHDNSAFKKGIYDCMGSMKDAAAEEKKKAEGAATTKDCEVVSNWTSEGHVSMKARRGYEEVLSITINSKTGTPTSICVLGEEILDCKPFENPVRIQLHRAPTDNDIGYLSRWKACGLDRRLQYVKRTTAAKGTEDSFTNLECVAIRVSPQKDLVETKWDLEPSRFDDNLVKHIKYIQLFASDTSRRETTLGVITAHEESFICDLCGLMCLGRKSVPSATGHGVQISIWKPKPFFLNSTIKGALALLGQPLLNATLKSETDSVVVARPKVSVAASYRISKSGVFSVSYNIDATSLPVVLPRIGLQLDVKSSFDSIMWKGLGPHESYGDRRTSCINAVHDSQVDELRVPYIVPCENGNRCEIDWLSIRQKSQPEESAIIITSAAYGSRFNFSASTVSTEAATMARNDSGVHTSSNLTTGYHLNLDARIMGCGGEDSWSACVHDDFLIPPGKYTVAFDIQ